MTEWLSKDEQRIWRRYLSSQRELVAALARRMQRDSSLSMPDFEVLVMLTDEADGRLRICDLAERLQWERSRLSHHLTRMTKRGLVEREGCGDDARGAFAVVTPAGREAIAAAAPGHVSVVRRLVIDALSPEELREWDALNGKILNAIDADDSI